MKTWIGAAMVAATVSFGGDVAICSAVAAPQSSQRVTPQKTPEATDISARRRHHHHHHRHHMHRRYVAQPYYRTYREPYYYGSSFGYLPYGFGGGGHHGFGHHGLGYHGGHHGFGHHGGHHGGGHH